jgi:hypothetical protein
MILFFLFRLTHPSHSLYRLIINNTRKLVFYFVGSRRAEQLSLRSQQRIVATVEESVLRMEMTGLESQEEDAPNVFSSSSR